MWRFLTLRGIFQTPDHDLSPMPEFVVCFYFSFNFGTVYETRDMCDKLNVRLLDDNDSDLVSKNGPIHDLLKHKIMRDGPRNHLGRGVPTPNASWLKQNNTRKIVAMWDSDESENISQIGKKRKRDFPSSNVVGICTVQIQPKYKKATLEMIKARKGTPAAVGTSLMTFVEEMCWREGIDEIRLTVDKDNDRAIALYLRRGFAIDEDRQMKSKYQKKEVCMTLKYVGDCNMSIDNRKDSSNSSNSNSSSSSDSTRRDSTGDRAVTNSSDTSAAVDADKAGEVH